MKPTFYWQNLLENKCPKCGGKLFERKGNGDTWHNCFDADCDFRITDHKLLEMMRDEKHPIRRYMSPALIDRVEQLELV